ncbi:MAG: putative drug exporter of the superfamily, partial [Mycobacterium sp.]|nr:putative drug exporter of the superfamily [Mycobacterium sp.]
MTSRHSGPLEAAPRPVIARAIRLFAIPIIVGWIALTVVVNVIAPSLDKVGAA